MFHCSAVAPPPHPQSCTVKVIPGVAGSHLDQSAAGAQTWAEVPAGCRGSGGVLRESAGSQRGALGPHSTSLLGPGHASCVHWMGLWRVRGPDSPPRGPAASPRVGSAGRVYADSRSLPLSGGNAVTAASVQWHGEGLRPGRTSVFIPQGLLQLKKQGSTCRRGHSRGFCDCPSLHPLSHTSLGPRPRGGPPALPNRPGARGLSEPSGTWPGNCFASLQVCGFQAEVPSLSLAQAVLEVRLGVPGRRAGDLLLPRGWDPRRAQLAAAELGPGSGVSRPGPSGSVHAERGHGAGSKDSTGPSRAGMAFVRE